MYKESISKLRFENYFVKGLKFDINSEFESTDYLELDIDFNQELELDYEQKKAIIVLECKLFENAIEKNYPFTLNVSLVGFFEFNSDLSEEQIINMLEVNGTAILFPYLRSIITTITSNIGIQPIILPTLNIVDMLRQKNNKDNI